MFQLWQFLGPNHIRFLSQIFPWFFCLFGLLVQLPTTKPTNLTDLNGPSQVVAPETDLFDFSYVVTFTRSSLAESGISLSTHVGRDGFWSDNFFCGERSNVNSWVFLKLSWLGWDLFVLWLMIFFFVVFFFLFGAVLFGINVCIPKKVVWWMFGCWNIAGEETTHTMWNFERWIVFS